MMMRKEQDPEGYKVYGEGDWGENGGISLHNYTVHELDTSEIIQIANKKKIEKNIRMYCDSAESDRIKMWKKAGYNAIGVKKNAGSVKAQIDYLKQIKIHIHPSCIDTISEIQQWKWKKDQKTGLYLDEPVEYMDDAMAALRYSINDKLKITSDGKYSDEIYQKGLGVKKNTSPYKDPTIF